MYIYHREASCITYFTTRARGSPCFATTPRLAEAENPTATEAMEDTSTVDSVHGTSIASLETQRLLAACHARLGSDNPYPLPPFYEFYDTFGTPLLRK